MTSIKSSNKTYLFLLFIIGVILCYYNYEQREYGWDMLGYLGSYYRVEIPEDNRVILNEVVSVIKQEAPKDQFEELVGFQDKQSWRHYIANHADAFQLQIPYYSVKVFYVLLIFCFLKLGFSVSLAVFLPNIISFFILGFLLYSIFKKVFTRNYLIPFLLTLFLLFIPSLRYLATISSPDMLVLLLMTWFFYSIVDHQKLAVQFMILLLVVFTRPDFIIFGLSYLGIYFLYDFIKNKKVNILPIILIAIMIFVCFSILKINGYPGWKEVFYDKFIQRRNWMTGNAEVTFGTYIDVILRNIIHFKKITVVSILCLGTVFYFSKEHWIRIFASLLFINIYLKFLLFLAPGEYRFYLPLLLLLFITAIYAASNKIRNLPF